MRCKKRNIPVVSVENPVAKCRKGHPQIHRVPNSIEVNQQLSVVAKSRSITCTYCHGSPQLMEEHLANNCANVPIEIK